MSIEVLDISEDSVDMSVYADYELECPFCECSYLSIDFDFDKVNYKCSNCGGEWKVLME